MSELSEFLKGRTVLEIYFHHWQDGKDPKSGPAFAEEPLFPGQPPVYMVFSQNEEFLGFLNQRPGPTSKLEDLQFFGPPVQSNGGMIGGTQPLIGEEVRAKQGLKPVL